MKYLGSKTLFVLTVSIVMLLLGVLNPRLSLEWLKNFNPEVLFAIGVFSSLMSSGIYYFWRFNEASDNHFGALYNKKVPENDFELFRVKDLIFVKGDNDEDNSSDISRWYLRILLFFSTFMIALLTMNNRGLQLLTRYDEQLKTPESHFCQDEEPEEEDDPSKAGCDLILKAWQMGYVKDLGTCAPDEEEEILQAICKKRQKDEPWLHYSYRKLLSATDFLGRYLGDDFSLRSSKRFDRQVLDLQTLGDQQVLALTNKPRSAHHIWTNLPNPRGVWGEVLEFLGGGNDCLEDWTSMNPVLKIHEADDYAKAQTYKHSVGHMLFNSTHQSGVGYCREYTIHWGASLSTCDDLVAEPEAVLSEEGALPEVQNILRRYRNRLTLDDLKRDIKEFDPKTSDDFQRLQALIDSVGEKKDSKKKDSEKEIKPKSVDQVVSFQCIFIDDKNKASNRKQSFVYDREGFPVYTLAFQGNQLVTEAENRFHPTPLRQLGPGLVPDFSYGQWMSKERPDLESAKDDIRSRLSAPGDMMLTRLEYLKNADIVLGHKWINKREDLLEVYPWYLHLHHYVKVFRERYQEKRGRL